MFMHYGPTDLRWDFDDKKSGIEIDTINNFHKIAIAKKPRILISRGQYQVNPVGLSDNLAEDIPYDTTGIKKKVRMATVQGSAQILIEATQEGTLEKVVEFTQNFLVRAAPLIAQSQGFKIFGLPMNVSSPMPSKEDIELFQCTIQIPYLREEHWTVGEESISLKNFIFSAANAPTVP
jgi:hypothetical protein